MNYDYFAYTAQGGRSKNEDAYSVKASDGQCLAVVADGVGGAGDGEQASGCAVQYVMESLSDRSMDEDLLYETIEQANAEVCKLHTDGKNMMTTIAAVWTKGEAALALNVGDSRIYQFREGRIVFQSTDHSVAQMAVFSGEITADQIRTYPRRNRITRALGADTAVKSDLSELTVQEGDALLLCSDGFWELITEKEMSALWEPNITAEHWLNAMQQVVTNRCGSRSDNNTAVLVVLHM